MRHLALLLLLTGCPAPKDVDLDGIVGKRDRCPREAESQNGYADDDGCPDQLARLLVRVVDPAHQPVAGAVVSLPGATPVPTDKTGVAVWFELLPVPELMVEASHPSGPRAQATLALPEGASEVTIVLSDLPEAP